MVYYNIKTSWDPKIIGVKNGIYQVELLEKKYTKEYLVQFNKYFHSELLLDNSLPPFDIVFHFQKLKLARLTDVISFSPYLNYCHFILNDKAIRCLERFNVQNYHLLPVVIYDEHGKETDTNYKMFFCKLMDWNIIDFKNTVFSTGGYGNFEIQYHTFINYEDYKKFNKITKVTKLGLNKEFDNSLDFFCTRLGGIFISNALKNEFLENNITGLDVDIPKEVELQ